MHFLLVEVGSQIQFFSFLFAEREHIRRVVHAININTLLHEIQQDSSRSTANVEHRLTKFFDCGKIKETIFPGGSVAAEQVPEFRHEAVVFVGGGCHKSPIVSGKWVMGTVLVK